MLELLLFVALSAQPHPCQGIPSKAQFDACIEARGVAPMPRTDMFPTYCHDLYADDLPKMRVCLQQMADDDARQADLAREAHALITAAMEQELPALTAVVARMQAEAAWHATRRWWKPWTWWR